MMADQVLNTVMIPVEEYAELRAQLERLRACMKAILAAAGDNGAAESRLDACKKIAAESIGEG